MLVQFELYVNMMGFISIWGTNCRVHEHHKQSINHITQTTNPFELIMQVCRVYWLKNQSINHTNQLYGKITLHPQSNQSIIHITVEIREKYHLTGIKSQSVNRFSNNNKNWKEKWGKLTLLKQKENRQQYFEGNQHSIKGNLSPCLQKLYSRP
jgi:cytosine/uracil/thiamine/allantoin permease